MVLEIFDHESVNSTFTHKKWRNPNNRRKLNLNINLDEIRYLEFPDIIDYKLVYDSEIQNDGSNGLNEIHQYTEVFAFVELTTSNVKIPYYFALVKYRIYMVMLRHSFCLNFTKIFLFIN